MVNESGHGHVYLRQVLETERTSLTVLAALVERGQRVLDLGTGSGALGQYLREHAGCTVDGVTYNPDEAALAQPHYRRLEIADLDKADIAALFSGEQYDRIVCADVLEHLKSPERVMAACRTLLAPGGRVLISVPNAAYAGLVAELMHGDFTYREEGLLDRTHLRFFTRRSLGEFLSAQGWALEASDSIVRELPESEFRVAFDHLPPAVARYLLADPEALTYQLIASACPADVRNEGAIPQPPLVENRQPRFSVSLYRGRDGQYAEADKLVASGTIGQERQQIVFSLSAQDQQTDRLRLDPADRCGYLHLYRLTLRDAAGTACWQWRSDDQGLAPLAQSPHHQVMFRPFWPGSAAALMLLYGEDPWIELPVPRGVLTDCLGAGRALLEVELGWPMSADYMVMADQVAPLVSRVAELEHHAGQLARQARELEDRLAAARHKGEVLEHDRQGLTRNNRELQGALTRVQHEHDALAAHLRWIENSTVFRATRPLVHFKMWLQQQWRGDAPEGAAAPPPAAPMPVPDTPVDVIVPVYRGLEDTRCCIESVLASTCQTGWRLIVINDASPEPAVTQWVREAAAREPRITLLENTENLGFVGTVNRGMALSDSHDVLLLNSDAEVANDWLDRIRRAAYSDARVASVTPFSNNATICSYPRFCKDNDLPEGMDTATLDRLFAQANDGAVVDVPTGVGFCMYIRRDCLAQVGLFDVANFGKGYGEENDFCRRAARAGWRNLHALDTFVRHAGGVSFGDSKSPREREAVEKLRRLHPGYDTLVHRFVQADPARVYRQRVDIARMRAKPLPAVLTVVHDRSGGTVRHVRELARHLAERAQFFMLTPVPGASVALTWLDDPDSMRLVFRLPAELDALVEALRGFGVAHIHYHHLLGHAPQVLTLPDLLGVRHDFTTHDFYAMCPQISLTDFSDSYCGELGVAQCTDCLARSPAPGGVDIETWRDRHELLLLRARHVLAPSRDAAARFVRMFPGAPVRVAPHVDLPEGTVLPVPSPAPIAADAPLKIVVIGALSRIKGADLLEDVARLAAQSSVPVEFHLVGFAYRKLVTQPHARLTVHGAYEEEDLPGLLAWLKPDLAWFPALWPETYSYTLSACLVAGLPVVAPDLGAFAERLNGRPWTWVRAWRADPAQWLAFFTEVRSQHFVTGTSPSPTWQLASASAGVQTQPWDYEHDYLDGIAALPQLELDMSFLLRHAERAAEPGPATARGRLSQLTLNLLVRLRGSKALSGVARAIPLRWQTRIKSWLLA